MTKIIAWCVRIIAVCTLLIPVGYGCLFAGWLKEAEGWNFWICLYTTVLIMCASIIFSCMGFKVFWTCAKNLELEAVQKQKPKPSVSKEIQPYVFDAEVVHEETPEELLAKLWKQQNEALLNILKGK